MLKIETTFDKIPEGTNDVYVYEFENNWVAFIKLKNPVPGCNAVKFYKPEPLELSADTPVGYCGAMGFKQH